MEQLLKSVGIDIGTSTTQLVFCTIKIENMAGAWTVPTIRIVEKSIFYKSDIHFTPLMDTYTLNAERIKNLILKEYDKAGLMPKDVRTGAVIITGEAARKENAKEIINMLSDLAGDFVVTTAGPDLEGILAGKGSGACAYSKDHACTVMNFDIGGGTTNVAVFKNGDIVDSACFDIGGRLIKLDQQGKVAYLSEKMKVLIRKIGLSIKVGDKTDKNTLCKITDIMADTIVNIAKGEYDDPILKLLITNHGLKIKIPLSYICLSGGVADCLTIQERDEYPFGDVGVLLGLSLKKALKNLELSILGAKETIRATVIGAGVHTTNISGSTIHYDHDVLPLKNIPVVKLTTEEESCTGIKRVEAIKRRVNWALHKGALPLVAFSINGSRNYSFETLQCLAEDIINGLDRIICSDEPLIVSVENDMAKALGLSLRRNLSQEKPVICIDSIRVDNGDYIDIGMPVVDGQVLPVIIKTLLFGY